uniref:DDE-1 domain-containing protein n=1 Tax=Amphimedon queenslandica TaxID=400682 RepID=A0A1X7VBE5_AMPQE
MSPLVVSRRGQQHPSCLLSGNKSQITLLACCNAAGYVIPPFVIFSGKIFKQELTNREIPKTKHGLSSSGWIDNELFETWFSNHFLAYAPASYPSLLNLDGHFFLANESVLQRKTSSYFVCHQILHTRCSPR